MANRNLLPPSGNKKLQYPNVPTNNDIVNLESGIEKLNTVMQHPEFKLWMYSGAARGIRQKILALDYQVIRNVVQKVPVINAIINTRIDQIMPYCHPVEGKDQKGFKIVAREGIEPDRKKIHLFRDFYEMTGFIDDPEREDDLVDYIQKIVRDTLEIDQIATQLQFNRMGQVVAFWALDASYIKRVDPDESDFPRDVRFVQLIENKVYNTYGYRDLLFDYKNKRSNLIYNGYGYSPIEQCIDVITTLLFGFNYVRDQFLRDRMPKGYISVMGDASQEQLDSIQRYWYYAMTGAGASWNIPVLPSGKEGVGIEFKQIGQSNRDMEYHRAMMFLSSIIGAVFSMDLAEIGIKSDDSQAVIGENSQPRINMSRERGLSAIISFVEQHLNKVIRRVDPDYRFKFIGTELDDEIKQADLETKQIASTMSIDQILEKKGQKPFNEKWSKIVLNDKVVQMILAKEQQNFEKQQVAAQAGQDQSATENPSGQIQFDMAPGTTEEAKPSKSAKSMKKSELFKALTDYGMEHILID